MLSLKSFHLFFMTLSIVLWAGVAIWGWLNSYPLLGAVSLGVGLFLVVYEGYITWKARQIHL